MRRPDPRNCARPRRGLGALAVVAGLAVGALAGLSGCSSMSPPSATALDASRANMALTDLESGRSLLMRKCGSCHRPPMPDAHARAEWPSKLDEMSERSHLDTQQRHLIQSYLVTMASR